MSCISKANEGKKLPLEVTLQFSADTSWLLLATWGMHHAHQHCVCWKPTRRTEQASRVSRFVWDQSRPQKHLPLGNYPSAVGLIGLGHVDL